jgi:hypothetical protein
MENVIDNLLSVIMDSSIEKHHNIEIVDIIRLLTTVIVTELMYL